MSTSKTIAYNKNNRILWGLLAALWLIVSTCAMQNVFALAIGSSIQSEQVTKLNKDKTSVNTSVYSCSATGQVKEDFVLPKIQDQAQGQTWVAIISLGVLFLLSGFNVLRTLEVPHWVSKDPGLYLGIPLFLAYENFRI